MPLECDYLPIAVASGANVDTQADFVGSGYQTVGFISGFAISDKLNKCLRQSSMSAAALANFISNQLGIAVLDDGNLPNLITNLTNAIIQAGSHIVYQNLVPVTVNANTTGQQPLMQYVIPAGAMNSVGEVIRLTASGAFTTSGSAETITFYVNYGSTYYPILNITSTGSVSSGISWRFVLELITTAAGSSGTLTGGSTGSCAPNGTVLSNIAGSGGPLITPIDLTSNQTIGFSVAFNSASVSNSGTQNYLLVEDVN